MSDSQSVYSQCQLSVRFAVTELGDSDSVAVSRASSISQVGRLAPSLTSEPVHVGCISREDVVVFTEVPRDTVVACDGGFSQQVLLE